MHPCRMEQIDSVKINPSLVMMRECGVWGVQDIKARWHTPPHIQCVSDQNYFGLLSFNLARA